MNSRLTTGHTDQQLGPDGEPPPPPIQQVERGASQNIEHVEIGVVPFTV